MVNEFLGDNPNKKDIIKISITTLIVTTIIGYFNYSEISGLPIWKAILFFIILADIFAGAVGNFTKSTQLKYSNNTKKRVSFLFAHIVHIGVLVLAVGHVYYGFGVLAFTIASGLIVNFTGTVKNQEINAAVAFCVGIILFYVVFPAPQILVWLPAILLVKLVFGFSIRREDKYADH